MYSPHSTTDTLPALARPVQDPWRDLAEAAKALGCSERTVQRYTKEDETRPGSPVLLVAQPSRGVWLFRQSWIDSFLDATASVASARRAAERPPTPPAPTVAAVDPLVGRVTAPRRRRRRLAPGHQSDPSFLPIPR